MRFAVWALLAWVCLGWSARGEGVELTVEGIVLKDAVEADRNVATVLEKPITGRFEAAPGGEGKAVVVAQEKVIFEAGGKAVSFLLKPGDFVGSLAWTSNDAATLVVWNTRGVGQWLRYLLSVSVDETGVVKHRLVKANQISEKLTVLKLMAKEKDGVRARVRVLGEDRKVRYFEGLLDIAGLPDLSAKAAAQYGPRVEG